VDSALAGLRRLLVRIAGPDVDLVVEVGAGLPPSRCQLGAFQLVLVELVRVTSERIADRGRIVVHAWRTRDRCCSPWRTASPGGWATSSRRLRAVSPTKSRGASAETGLAAVHDVLASNDAEVDVTATPGGGSKFSIYLPLWA